jgi:hypothetical protein
MFLGKDTFTVIAKSGAIYLRADYELTVVPIKTRSEVRAGRRGHIRSCGVRRSRACAARSSKRMAISLRIGPSPVRCLSRVRVRLIYYRRAGNRWVPEKRIKVKTRLAGRWKSIAFAPPSAGRWAVRVLTPRTKFSKASRSRLLYLKAR